PPGRERRVLDSSKPSPGHLNLGACIAAAQPAGLSPPAQSEPQTLSTAVGALPTILYSTVTDLSRALRPGASFGVVFPPAFRTPRSVIVSSGRLSHARTIFLISTSAPSTPILIC